ncbi:unnamed protein product [Miscanthus lutarioriparius]|uniref:Protein HESO1 n=1 Tax=Miscanthus lutarioriparius TaxID=422564 RepID=A0A811NWQ8_9POAL|nr:unnamed protein product [Miscanthus lutarioriparius]
MPPQDFGMVDSVHDNIVLNKCIKDILALIKPVEDDRSKRLSTIQELENCIHSLASLSGAAVKPFGSFVSDLYSKSGVTGYMQFIPHARVPVLQYVSNRFGISCDISIDNFVGRIKSKIFYWINTLDERFGDMVLLIKEWAKAQNINDPKSGSLNSYSLCLLVLFHFQTSEPPILPPLNEIYEGNITGDVTEAALYNDQHLDEVEDPVERPDNAARAVSMKGLDRIASAFNDACHKFYSLEHIDRNGALLCTPVVGLKLGGKVIANPYPKTPQRNNQHTRNGGRAGRDQGQAPRARGFAGIRSVHKDPLANTAHETAVQYRNHPQATTVRQTAIPYTGRNLQTHTTVHQTMPYQNHIVPQVYPTWPQTAEPYQNHNKQVYATGLQTTAIPYTGRNLQTHTTVHQTTPYQNHIVPQVYPTWSQTAEPYQNHNKQVYATGLQTGPYQSHNQVYASRFQTGPYQSRRHQVYRAPGGTYQIHNRQAYNAGFQTDSLHQNQQRRKGYTSNHQTNRHAAMAARYEPVRGQLNNGSTWDSRSQAADSAASQR